MSGSASRTPTRKAFACESNAVSHCFRLISSGDWKNSGTSGRALLTNMSSLPKSVFTRRNIPVTDSGRVTSAWIRTPSDPRLRTSASVAFAAASFW